MGAMNQAAALLGTAGVAMTACAGQRNAINIMVSEDGGATWSESASFFLGGPSSVTVGVFYERDTGYGFAGSVHNIVVSSWAPGDSVTLADRADSAQHPDGRQGRFNFGAQRQAAYTTGADAGRLRIAAANNSQDAIGGGVSIRQNTPPASGTLFDTSNPAYGFRFELAIDLSVGPRVLFVTTPRDRVNNFALYSTAGSTLGENQPIDSVVLDGAQIIVWPTPGTVSALAVTGLWIVSARRRIAAR